MTTEESASATERHLAMGQPEPVAAEKIDEGTCKYEDCDAEAEYRVEWEATGGLSGTTIMCGDCSRDNRIYVDENDLLDYEVDHAAE